MKPIDLPLAAAFVALAMSGPALAQSAPVNGVDLATALLEAGDPAKACIVLDVMYGEETADPGALRAYAECRRQLGDFPGAGAFYRRVLAIEPDAPQLRERVSALEQADKALVASLQSPSAPAPLAAPALSGSVSLSRFYDSNVNGGTSADTVDAVFAGIPLTLTIAPDAKGAADSGTAIGGVINYLLPLDQSSALMFRANGSATLLDDITSQSRAELGVSMSYLGGGPLYSFSLRPSGTVTLDQDGVDRASVGLDGQFNWPLTPDTMLSATGGIARRTIVDSSAESSWAGYVGIGATQHLADDITAGARFSVSRNAAGAASNSHWGLGPELFVQARLSEEFTLDATYGISKLVYDDTIGLFSGSRSDIRQQIGVSATYDLGDIVPDLAVDAAYNYAVTDSNIALYDSDRHQVSIGLSYSF